MNIHRIKINGVSEIDGCLDIKKIVVNLVVLKRHSFLIFNLRILN